MMWQPGENFELNFAFLYCHKKVSKQKSRKTTLWTTVVKSFPWDKISSWTKGKGGKMDMYLFTWILVKGLPKWASHTVMFISLKNRSQLLNTVCWKVKWMVANTKSSIKENLAKHPHYKLRRLVFLHPVLRSIPYMNSDCYVTRRKSFQAE